MRLVSLSSLIIGIRLTIAVNPRLCAISLRISNATRANELHDLARDMKGGTRQEFIENCRRNLETRIIHHHVFDEENAEAMLAFAGLTIVHKEFSKPWNIVLVARM